MQLFFFKGNYVVSMERFKDELIEEDKHKNIFEDYKKHLKTKKTSNKKPI